MFGEYKLIAYGVIGLFLLGFGTTAVLSYNHFVGKAALQEEQIKIRDGVINDQQVMVADQQRQAELAKKYQMEAERRRIDSDNRIKQILSMETKRDDKGNITPDDPILISLNGMYPDNQTGEDKTDSSSGATVPESTRPPGELASGKDILPE